MRRCPICQRPTIDADLVRHPYVYGQANEQALEHNERLFSVYYDREGTKFYIITEHDRSVTTVLLPEDY